MVCDDRVLSPARVYIVLLNLNTQRLLEYVQASSFWYTAFLSPIFLSVIVGIWTFTTSQR